MAPPSEAEIQHLKKFMKDSSFTFTDEWLLACLEWIQDNFNPVNRSIFVRELREQWKDANLEEMESLCLPSNLSTRRHVKLPGKYGLQVNSVRDIGESSYSQWTKLKKLENENVSVAATDSTEFKPTWQPTPKRCLYLNMTDGKQKVFGLEMQPIPGLTLQMKPGTKVVIAGPVDCRHGVIHLKPNNVQIIGGEVEELIDSNSLENSLAKTLKLSSDAISKALQPQSRLTAATTTQSTAAFPDPQEPDWGEFPDSENQFPGSTFGDDIFMEIDEEALISSATADNQVASTTASYARIQNQGRNETLTKPVTFTEDIEDYEDDPSYSDMRTIPVHKLTAACNKAIPNVVNNETKTSKSVFVPPAVVSKKPSNSTVVKSEKAGASSCHSSSKTQRPPISTANIKTEGVIAGLPAFRSSKISPSNGNNCSGKQLNILQYLKPMPVVIDPPTPERQLKRRRKSEDEGVSKNNVEEETMPQKPDTGRMQLAINEIREETEYTGDHSPDDSLMHIIDQTVESKLLEYDQQEEAGLSENDATKIQNTSSSSKVYPVRVSEHPYMFLKQVQENMEQYEDSRKVVYVKACISTVLSSISVEKGYWTLNVCINDGTGYLNCKLSAEILNNTIGFTPDEMKQMKATKTKEAKQRLAEGMNGLSRKLVHLNAIFAIEIGPHPKILEIINVLLNHSTALQDRLRQL